MKQSESISKLASALVRAQGQLRHAKENAVNPHFKNSYADLSSVIDTVKPIFAECGLAVIQFETFEPPNVVSVETVLLHESGEFISEKSGCLAVKADPQGIGSAITYLRRYSLAALAGITQSDDDGETQRSAKKAESPKQAEQEEKQKPIYQAVIIPESIKVGNIVTDTDLEFAKANSELVKNAGLICSAVRENGTRIWLKR